MTEVLPDRLVREMGYTRDEFAAVLPRAFAGWAIAGESADQWRVAAVDCAAAARIRVAAAPARRLGALVLPVLRVQIDFLTDDPVDRQCFLKRFDRGFQKGGG